MKKFVLFFFLTLALLLGGRTSAPAAPGLTEDQLRRMLEAHPDILLGVLQKHSEELLDLVQSGATSRRNKAIVNEWRRSLKQPAPNVELRGRYIKGPEKAPLTIIAYSDFTCPFCQKGANTIRRILKERKDQVRYVFKAYPLDSKGFGRLAAAYFLAAGLQSEAKAWKLHDLLFSSRAELVQDGEKTLKKMAAEAGLDLNRLADDIKSARVNEMLDTDYAEGARLNLEGTPTYFINQLAVHGALAPELFDKAIEMALTTAPRP